MNLETLANLWNDVTAKEEATCHELSLPRITFYHLITGFKALIGYLRDGELFVKCSLTEKKKLCCVNLKIPDVRE